MTNRKQWKTWTKEELTYLKEKYGTIPTSQIANKLGRTEGGVKHKAQSLFKGMQWHEVQGLYSFKDIERAFGIRAEHVTRWRDKRGMPSIKIEKEKISYYAIEIKAFWKWLENKKNEVKIQMNKVNLDVFEYYPDWFLDDYRNKKDYHHRSRKEWSEKDVSTIISLYYEKQVKIKDIAFYLDRSESSVWHKLKSIAESRMKKDKKLT